MRTAIQRSKDYRDLGLAETLSRHLIGCLQNLAWPIDLVTAVPLSLKRIRERGFNQSDLLARPISLALRIPYQPGAVYRNRETVSQVGLTAAERRENVRDAFAARPNLVNDKNILIIDDVATTGATLNYCSTALLQSGARGVYCLTLARAGVPDHNEKRG